MADFFQYLAALDSDPDDVAALAGLTAQAPGAAADPSALVALADARKSLRERNRLDVVARLYDVEVGAIAEPARKADLLLEKGTLLEDELLDERAAVACFREVLSLRPGDETATETLQQIEEERDNWEKFAGKYLDEASGSTDRQLATSLYLSAAEIWARHRPGSPEVEQFLRRALEIDPRNRRAAMHLERILRAAQRWRELATLLAERVEAAASRDERIAGLLGQADVQRLHLGEAEAAIESIKKVIALDAAHPQALRALADVYEQREDWQGLVKLYGAALAAFRARRGSERDELGMLLQVAMVQWKRLGELDAAEEHFRRIRKVEPGHPAALDFYRVYLPARGEGAKLVQMLRQAEAQLPPATPGDSRRRALSIEIAELAEAQLGNPEKAIEAWKQLLRTDPSSTEARAALARLYRRTEKWNALLDLMKEDIDRLPEADVKGRVERLLEVVDIYRDRLKLDVMVINTYNTILKLDPDHRRAIEELSVKYRALSRWNDLIAILGKKAELGVLPIAERTTILREIADLWGDRFGNFAQAIRPLERLLELAPDDADAIARLKDIYTRRRQWRALIGLLQKEADALPAEGRRGKLAEMARLAAERLGDNRLAIEIQNLALSEALAAGGDDEEAPGIAEPLTALAGLYEREKRWLALAEILRRQRARVRGAEAVTLLEKLGALFADRLGAPALAAEAMSEILRIDPSHGRALRMLRELYAAAGDYDGLERLYGQLGQWDELVDALLGIGDRLDDRAARLGVLERAARVAQRRADEGGRADAADRAARAWERILAVAPQHAAAAAALAPLYVRGEKWSRLLPVLEVLLAHAATDDERLRRSLEIRDLCEQRLGSKALAFAWTARASDLAPADDKLVADLLRLAQEPEQWQEVAALLDRHASAPVAPPVRLRLYRELGRIAQVRLHDPERARAYQRKVLEILPDDPQAVTHLEEIAIQLTDWPSLLASYRRRAEREPEVAARLELLFKVAFIEEERLADLDAAVATYAQILAHDPKSIRALRALGRIQEARGDWEGLDQALSAELALAGDDDSRFDLLMRLGGLEEKSLERPGAALDRYLSALAVPGAGGMPRAAAIAAALRFLDGDGPARGVPLDRRVVLAATLLPNFERARDASRIARALEVLRAGTAAQPGPESTGAVALDRRLIAIYSGELADPARAWDAALRVLTAEPTDRMVRTTLDRLALMLDRDVELARHLGAALDSARTAGAPPSEIRTLAADLAELHEERLDDKGAAERAWQAVLDVDPTAVDAFEALARLLRAGNRWTDLRTLLERRADVTLDDEVRASALLELAALEEDVLGDAGRAIAVHRRVLELDPAHLPSYKALERLYGDAQAWRELEDLLARERDHVSPAEQLGLDYRRAELRARHLADPAGAVDLLEEIVNRQRGHADARELLEEILPVADLRLRVARILEPLYEADRLWKDLVAVLRAQQELAGGPAESGDLLARIALLEEVELGNGKGAFDTWIQALATDASDERPRRALSRLAGGYERWPEAAAAWERAASATGSHETMVRAGLFAELGEIYDMRLGDTERAIGAYRRLLDVDPGNPSTVRQAAAALARLYDEEDRWADLRTIVRRQADWAEGPDERKALLARAAILEEDKLGDRSAAITTWREVLSEDHDDPAALDALERLYGAGQRWAELVDILRRRVEHGGEPQAIKALLRRVAEIHEVRLAQPVDAVTAHLEVLDHVPDDPQTLAELSRLYRAGGRHADLLDILERRLALGSEIDARAPWPTGAQVAELVALEAEIAELLAGPLGREREALERWAQVLVRDPGHPRAMAAVEHAMDDVDLRLRAAEILRPLYQQLGHDDKLAGLLLRVAETTDDVRERLRCLVEVAALREERLGDVEGAFTAAVLALEAAVAEPELPDLVGEVERLAEKLGREGDLIDIYRRIAPDVLDGDLQRRLYLDVADLARAVRGDVQLARDHYQKVLDAVPDDPRALNALESIHREAGEHDRLFEILSRKAELAGDDVDERVIALAEAAALCAGPLKRFDDAIAAWEQVLELEPARHDAVAALEELYRGGARWHDLVDLYERRLGFAFTVEEAVNLRLKLAAIHDKELSDPEAAVESYAAALGGDPANRAALTALERYLDDPAVRASAAEVLEPIYVSRQDWNRLVRIYEIKLDAASDPEERLRLTRYIARLYEEQLEDFEGAARWYARVFRESPDDAAIRDQLQRLATILENWSFVANVYQEYLDDTPGDAPEVRDIALAAAQIYDRRLADVERGQLAYRRALAIPASPASVPDNREVFRRLENLLVRSERWFALVEVYEEAVAAAASAGEEQRVVDLYGRLARVQEDNLRNVGRAIDAWREILNVSGDQIQPWDAAAIQLDRLFRLQSQWYDLADLLNARIERSTVDEREVELRLQLADILEQKLGDVAGALEQYEVVLASRHGWELAVPHLERLVVQDDHRERIADLLEPVYRASDWWQKLVVILDAKLDYVDDPARKVETLREIAHIHETRGGDPELAFGALARAWRIDVADTDVFDALTAQAAAIGAWDDLVTTLEAGVVGVFDPEVIATVLSRVAEVHEAQRGDRPAAIQAWRRVLDARPDDPVALGALDRLLAVEGRADELVTVVERRADLTDDAGTKLVLLHRVASLYEEVLERPREAITAYRNVLAVDDTDGASLDALERLYRQVGDGHELAATLLRKIELAVLPGEQRQLHFAAAAVYEKDLRDVYEAIAQLQAVLADDPADLDALAELDRLYGGERMWPELLDVIDRRALLAIAAGDRADLAYRAARIVEVELAEPDDAIPRYGAVLDLFARHADARAALEGLMAQASDQHLEPASAVLERVFRREREVDGLVRLYERRLAASGVDPSARRSQWAALAEVHETLRGDPDAAFQTWARALAEAPDDLELLAPLERLAAARGAWAALTEILEERADGRLDAELEYAYTTRLGQIYEEALGDLPKAAVALRRAASVAPDERVPLAALDRVLARSSRWSELAEVLAREAEAASDDVAAAEFLFRLGDLREAALGDLGGAVAAYREVLLRAPRHPAGRGALERLLVTAEEHRPDIIDTLEPLYESEGDWLRLADLLTAKLAVIRDHGERSGIYQRIAELAEIKLGDTVRALDAAGGWLAEDPSSTEALAEVDRLAASLGRWGEAAARLSGIASTIENREARLALLLHLGQIQLDRLGDGAAAGETYRAALAIDDEVMPALDALARIHRQSGDLVALAEIQWRRGELAFDPTEKRTALAEVGVLRERLGRDDDAITAWKAVLDLDEGDREAIDRLAFLYERKRDWHALVETLGQAARFAVSPEEEKALRVRIAQLWADALDDLPAAASAWQQVLDLDGEDSAALVALEQVHARADDWTSVQEVLTRRLDLARSTADKVALLGQLARLAEDRRDSADDAIAQWFAVLDVDRAHLPAYGELERLLVRGERWHDLVELLERQAELQATLGDGRGELTSLARAADVWESKLDDPDAAGDILEKILTRDPASVAALTRLARIHERAGDWERGGEVLQRALALGPRGTDAADLFFRLGEVAHKASGDLETAVGHWRTALGHDAAHLPSIEALEKVARERGDLALLADLLARRESATVDAAGKLALLIELADVQRKLGRPEAAVPLLARAAEAAPGDMRILAPLADLYFASGRLDEAAPIYDRLAEDAKGQRRMKDVARYRQRQGGILEARGDSAGALAAYEEAFRVNPTDVPTMAGLGRLYMAARDWEKARRVYRSLVLQTLEPDAGVTKAHVYWSLGVIHIELGEAPKAKGMFQRGLELEPDNAALRDALARLA
jgi:tetratricopeptide (TPR) repeat protein